MILRFAKKNSSSNREIEKYYGENDTIETEEEYKLIMLEVKIMVATIEPFKCLFRAIGGPDNYHHVYFDRIESDLGNFFPIESDLSKDRPSNVPSNGMYTQ